MGRTRSLLLAAVLALLAAGLFGVFALSLLSSEGSSRLGDETFDTNAAFLARQIEEGGPVLFQDLLGRDRDLYVQHLAGPLDQGWRAFKATAPGQPRRCTLTWDREANVFRDTRCGTAATFPADGSGLEQYATRVDGNKLVIDLRQTARTGP